MIGVFCHDIERKTTQEFFELFKTPWEFVTSTGVYDVILSTRSEVPNINVRLIVIYSSTVTQFDTLEGVTLQPVACKHLVTANNMQVPIYGDLTGLQGKGISLIQTVPNSDVIAIDFISPQKNVIRVGFDLFQEVARLLSLGQSLENAPFPTLELHIALLRDWIISAGILLVEIPPIPFGYNFFACLTHDVDFYGIHRHKFDHTMWGFIYRSLVGSLIKLFMGRINFAKFIKNWIAVMKLPFIYAGLADDLWEHFDKYAEIDTGFGSTFFLIPFKNKPGGNLERKDLRKRAVAYDISDVSKQVGHLIGRGCEIGLHGIDAWHCPEKGAEELKRIVDFSGAQKTGVRIHWLCYDSQSPAVLEQAGFDYDASLGFNETVGFRNGTTQVFQPAGVRRLLEIPLNIQDTALFYPRRLNLSDEKAYQLCQRILNNVLCFGGILTLSWHERSLEPERLWGDFYLRLLQELRDRGAWVGGARQVVDWFRQRRSVNFEEFCLRGEEFVLRISGENPVSGPKMILRFYIPSHSTNPMTLENKCQQIDVPWNGEKDIEISAESREVE